MLEITLGGRSYPLAATGGAMRRIEELGDLTLAELLEAHLHERLKLEELAAIAYAGLQAAEQSVAFSAVLDRIFELRVTSPMLRREIGAYLVELLYAPDDAKKRDAVMLSLEHGGNGSEADM